MATLPALSPGLDHLYVPTTLRDNLEYRLKVYDSATDAIIRRGIREICRNDFVFFVNVFCWQYNPLRKGDEVGPFVLWEMQVDACMEMLRCVEEGRDAIIEKSRELGGTYICLLLIVWLCAFHKYKKALIVSRSADAVDKSGDSDSIFWKIDHVLEHLPEWLLGPYERRRMIFDFHGTQSTITGQASTGDIGIGGRATLIFLDEFSRVKEDREVRQGTASTSDCRIFNGTHVGTDTEFFRLTQQPEIVKIVMHWSQHPEKRKGLYEFDPKRPSTPRILDPDYKYPDDFKFVLDGSPTGGPFPGRRSPWYDKKVQDIGSARGVAMDLDINPQGSVSQVFDPVIIERLIRQYASPPIWRGELHYHRESASPDGLYENATSGCLWLWLELTQEGKVPQRRYVIAVDNATGLGGKDSTATCATILDVGTGKKVGAYRNALISPEDFAYYAVALCKFFATDQGTPAKLGWEANGPGLQFGKEILDIGFQNVFYRDEEDSWSKGSVKPNAERRAGWYPTSQNKDQLIRTYNRALQTGEFFNQCEASLRDCLNFRWDNRGRVEHPKQKSKDDPAGAGINHGDRVIADAIACLMASKYTRMVKQEKIDQIPYGSILYRREQARLKRQQEEEGTDEALWVYG